MSTSNAGTPKSLAQSIQALIAKQRNVTEELARRAEAIAQNPHARRRTWRATRKEILGRPV